METLNSIIATHKRTWIGTLAGAGAGYYAGKKLMKTNKWWTTTLVIIAGAIAGSVIQDKCFSAKKIEVKNTNA